MVQSEMWNVIGDIKGMWKTDSLITIICLEFPISTIPNSLKKGEGCGNWEAACEVDKNKDISVSTKYNIEQKMWLFTDV
jgi:hypothetical protein